MYVALFQQFVVLSNKMATKVRIQFYRFISQILLEYHPACPKSVLILKLVGILWTRISVEVVDKLSSTTVDFIRSERELENMHLYGV